MDLYNLVVSAKLQKGGGSDIEVDELNVTENGVYSASSGYAYSPVNVSVPTGVFPSGTSQITSNGMYDVTNFASASVNVPGIVPSGISSITANGIYDITNFASVDVNVSGGGGDHDVEDGIIQRTISGVYTNSRVTNIGSYAFYRCGNLTTVSFPNVTNIGSYAFQYCSDLTTVSFPNVTNIGSYAFQNCSNLTTANFPNVTNIESYAFQNCSNLTTANFPNVTNIGNSVFKYCGSLTTAYFLASSVATLVHANAFYNTPMSNSTYTGSFGSIYVPASLVSDYKVANNWSIYADRITSYVE